MARKEAHGGRAPRASEKNPLPLSFHLGGLFLSPNFFALSPLSLSLSLSPKDGGGRAEHNATQAMPPPMRVRGKPLAPSLCSLSRLLPLICFHTGSCVTAPVMEEVPDVADPSAMSRRGSNEGWHNTGKVHSGFTSPRSSEVSPCSSSPPLACLWWDPAR